MNMFWLNFIKFFLKLDHNCLVLEDGTCLSTPPCAYGERNASHNLVIRDWLYFWRDTCESLLRPTLH